MPIELTLAEAATLKQRDELRRARQQWHTTLQRAQRKLQSDSGSQSLSRAQREDARRRRKVVLAALGDTLLHAPIARPLTRKPRRWRNGRNPKR